MLDATRNADLTIMDVVRGLESMELWARQLRDALATVDLEQPLDVKSELRAMATHVKGGQCPPGKTEKRAPKKGKKDKKKK